MPAKLVWSPLARIDIKNIYIEIGRQQPQAAERYFRQFRYKAELLREQPRMGRRYPDIALSARVLVEEPYLILYETIPDFDDTEISEVEIVRIVDGRRDLKALFR
jgi:toxin ParE1/3/4